MGEKQRLRKNSEFDAVYERGKSWAGDFLVLKALPNGLEWNRYGFVTGKRVGKAVVRNRVKRLLREVTKATPTNLGWDIVIVARGRAATASYSELKTAVSGLLHRARILADKDGAKGAGVNLE